MHAFYLTSAILAVRIEPTAKMVHSSPPQAGGAFRTFFVKFIYGQLAPLRQSIIVSTIVAAMNGIYGRQVVHEKTHYNPPWISPLTSLIWYFEADAVAKMKMFYEEAKSSMTVSDVAAAIEKAREQSTIKPFESIPI